jgi:tRNA(adenine34) deaminase
VAFVFWRIDSHRRLLLTDSGPGELSLEATQATEDCADDVFFMHLALQQARLAHLAGEVPVGAVVVVAGAVVGRGFNHPISGNDPTAHAEMVALRAAADNQQNYRLPGATVYVTLEPCTMCLGALIHARIQRVVFAALEPKAGRLCSHSLVQDTCFNHSLEITKGVCAEQASELLQTFFVERRALKKAAKLVAEKLVSE